MVEILVPSTLIELTAEIQQVLSVAKRNGFATNEVMLGVSPTSQFKISFADNGLVVGTDLIESLDRSGDIFLDYMTRHDSVRSPHERNSVSLGIIEGEHSFDIWHHPLNDEVRAFSYPNKPFEQAQQQRHFSWVITLLALQFPIEDCLSVARAAMHVSRETWPVDYACFPRPVLEDKRLGIKSLWLIQSAPNRFTHLNFAYLNKHQLGLYPVVDSSEWIERLLKLGVKTIQLRIKDPDKADLEAQIQRSIDLGKQYNGQVFINDYWQLALKYGAFGVHLGQEDIEYANLSLIEQAGIRLGLSTHGYFELLRISQINPSYIALGHIFPTTTKTMPSKPQGLVRLALYQRLINTIPYHQEFGYPTVAIGGIDLDTASSVWDCGVSSLAVVRAITLATRPKQVLLGFQTIMQRNVRVDSMGQGVEHVI